MALFKPKKNPRKASEVTKEWLERVLSQYESKTCPESTVEVVSFEVNPGCAKGDNFSSDVMRIVAEARVTCAGRTSSPNRYSFIVKFLCGNEMEQVASVKFGPPKRENITLSKVLPDFNAFLKERGGNKYRINAPEHVYDVCLAGEYVLVMQDLREAGFQVEDKRRGLNLVQLRTAVRDMAHLHATSYAFSQTQDFLAKYPAFKIEPATVSIIGGIGRVVIEGLQSALQGKEEEFPGLLAALTSNKDALVGKMTDAFNVSRKETVMCLCHGDFWTNNIMFKYDEEGAIQDFAMIDWGNVGWRSSVTDLQYLFYSSTHHDLRKDHLQEVQMFYYNTFTSAAASLGAALPHWHFEDFLTEWRNKAVEGMIFGVMVNLVTLSAFGRKFQRGTLTTGFTSWLKTKLGGVMVSTMYKKESLLVKFTCMAFRKEWEQSFDELASTSNPEMTTRVMNIVMEAFEAGVLDS